MKSLDICEMQLQGAASVAEVVAIVDLFVTTLPQRELEALPAGCRPRSIGSREDIAHWVERLGQFRLLLDLPPSREFAAVHQLFRHAAARIERIGPHRRVGALRAAA
jgi:hypothetical protein